jgi:hypothetical protein
MEIYQLAIDDPGRRANTVDEVMDARNIHYLAHGTIHNFLLRPNLHERRFLPGDRGLSECLSETGMDQKPTLVAEAVPWSIVY